MQKQTLEARIRGKTFREIYDASRRIETARARFQRAAQFSSLAFVELCRLETKSTSLRLCFNCSRQAQLKVSTLRVFSFSLRLCEICWRISQRREVKLKTQRTVLDELLISGKV
jgi:hypothetical protein